MIELVITLHADAQAGEETKRSMIFNRMNNALAVLAESYEECLESMKDEFGEVEESFEGGIFTISDGGFNWITLELNELN